MKKKYLTLIVVILALVIIDQVIKYFVIKNLTMSNIEVIKGFFSLTFLKNYGAAFGILSSSTIILIVLSLLLISYLIKELKKNSSIHYIISLTMIIGGSIGNLVDRISRGYVIDYLSFNIFNREMPVFNFADILITVGVTYLAILIIAEEKNGNSSK